MVVDLGARTVTVTHDGSPEPVLEALRDLDVGVTLVSDRAEGPSGDGSTGSAGAQRSALVLALAINAAFFVGELTAGVVSGSMGLVADSLECSRTRACTH